MPPDTFPDTVAELVLDGLPPEVQHQVFLLLCDRGHDEILWTYEWAERMAHIHCRAQTRAGKRCTAQTQPFCRTHWRMYKAGTLPKVYAANDWSDLEDLVQHVTEKRQEVLG